MTTTDIIDPDPGKGWFRRFVPLLRRHRGVVAVTLLTSVASQGLAYVIPLIVRLTIDDAIIAKTTPLGGLLVALAVVGAARYACSWLHHRSIWTAAANMQFDLRASLQERLGRQSFAFHDRMDTGEVLSRADNDIRTMQMFLIFAPAVAVLYVGFGVALAIMLAADVLLTVLVVSTVPVMVWLGIRMRTAAYPLAWLVQARMAGVSSAADENLEGARVVRSAAAEEAQIDAFDVAAQAHRWAGEREVVVRARYQPLMELSQQAAIAMFVLLGGLRAVAGRLTVGTFIMFVSYIALLQMPIRMTGFAVMMAQRARAGAGRILELVDHPFEVEDAPGAPALHVAGGRIELDNVSFGYGDSQDVLRDCNLEVGAGEKVALVGATATGKTTLTKLVLRFYDVDRGAVRIDGQDVREVTQESLRANIGLVMEDAFLFTASVRDNIAYARPDADDAAVWEAAVAAGAEPFIRNLPDGLDTIVGERGHTLSGGQKQRIAIARTLLQDPAILILDDATSAIDATTEQQIHHALERLLAGRTTLLIAHRPATIALADRVAVLHDGAICCTGRPQELLETCANYRRLFGTPAVREVVSS